MADTLKLSEVEHVKDASAYLRGTLAQSLRNPVTGALYPDDTHLIKFHGSYQQTDRDLDSRAQAPEAGAALLLYDKGAGARRRGHGGPVAAHG
jgi:sulfite reductase beta subunit-like hemoprotein